MRGFLGWFGEWRTGFKLWLGLDAETYVRFPNVILPSSSGTTQIDHIIVSAFGVFIVETKNLSGWIFGSQNKPVWTQSIYGWNYTFQNPLRQAHRQKVILASFLGLEESLIRPVIVFVGSGSFKTHMPSNVIRDGLIDYIRSFDNQVFTQKEVDRMVFLMEDHVETSTLTKADHLDSLKRRLQSTTVCPKCGSNLVERTIRKGPNVGTRFLGCGSYPKCKYTRGL